MAHRRTRQVLARIGISITLGGALAAAALASYGCTDIVAQPLQLSGAKAAQVGDPCYPGDEVDPQFPGFKLEQMNIEDRFDACQSGLCLVHHFQGRTSCPLGQPAPTPCQGPGDTQCGSGAACVATDTVVGDCDPSWAMASASQCGGGVCDPQTMKCVYTAAGQCPPGAAFDPSAKRCSHFACRTGAGCQDPSASAADNAGKVCCAEGSETPVSTAVCGQCAPGSPRAAADAVYCSCRCGLAAGDPGDAGALCACPDGMECAEIRPYLPGLPDPANQYAGKYCIKAGTAYDVPDSPDGGSSQCGKVQGFFDPAICGGTAN